MNTVWWLLSEEAIILSQSTSARRQSRESIQEKIWRICIMWVCPLLQKSFMPPKGFLGALRHHTVSRQAGKQAGRQGRLSKWFLCKTAAAAAALHHHAPFATMTRIICAPCKARRGPRRSSALWTGPKHSESPPPPPPWRTHTQK